MLISPLIRHLSFVLLGLVFLTGCASDLKTQGPGSGDGGSIYDPGSEPLPGDDSSTSALPPRLGNPDDADYSTLAPYTVYFGFDSFTIDAGERGKLVKTAEYLKEHPNVSVWLAGHTDARGTTQYNLSLGERRANATREYLIGLGVPASRLQTTSYGEERPAEAGSSEAAYAKNRRVQAGIVR